MTLSTAAPVVHPPLALHHFTLSDISPFELVPIAAQVGCDAVCIFVNSDPAPDAAPGSGKTLFPVITAATRAGFKSLLRDCGVRVTNIEYFPLEAHTDPDSFRASLELGAELGARLAVTHIHNPDRERALAQLVQFAGIAAEYELRLGLEFMGLTPACATLQQALDFVQRAAQPNVGLGIDAIHLHLTGGSPAQLGAVSADCIGYAQLCDSVHPFDPAVAADPARYLPQVFTRSAAGEGVIALDELVQQLPADTWFDVEVPWPQRRQQGVSALDHARHAVAATRALLQRCGR
jgi:sugar phosphate isomerase/epimerase